LFGFLLIVRLKQATDELLRLRKEVTVYKQHEEELAVQWKQGETSNNHALRMVGTLQTESDRLRQERYVSLDPMFFLEQCPRLLLLTCLLTCLVVWLFCSLFLSRYLVVLVLVFVLCSLFFVLCSLFLVFPNIIYQHSETSKRQLEEVKAAMVLKTEESVKICFFSF
jgi:hypothetical protein